MSVTILINRYFVIYKNKQSKQFHIFKHFRTATNRTRETEKILEGHLKIKENSGDREDNFNGTLGQGQPSSLLISGVIVNREAVDRDV